MVAVWSASALLALFVAFCGIDGNGGGEVDGRGVVDGQAVVEGMGVGFDE